MPPTRAFINTYFPLRTEKYAIEFPSGDHVGER